MLLSLYLAAQSRFTYTHQQTVVSFCAGAAVTTVLYDPLEDWCLAIVVTFCGVHRALPVTKHQSQALAKQQTSRLSWIENINARLQHSFFSLLTGNDSMAAAAAAAAGDGDAMLLDFKQPGIALDARGMWANDFEATSWAYKHLFNQCNQTHEMLAVQV